MGTARILYVAAPAPLSPNEGGRQRSDLLARALMEVGDVDMVGVRAFRYYSDDEIDEMRRRRGLVALCESTPRGGLGPWRAVRPLRPAVVDSLAHNVGRAGVTFRADRAIAPVVSALVARDRYDVIVGRYLRYAAHADLPAYRAALLDIDDLDSAVYDQRRRDPTLSPLARLVYRKHLAGARAAERRLLPRMAHLFVASEADLGRLDHPSVSVLPNLPYALADGLPDPPPPATGSRSLVFVGTCAHRANAAGLDWFIDAVWPRVRRAEPEATFSIVGTGVTEAQRSRWSRPGVLVRGFVPDVREAYADAAAAVGPVHAGGGTKIKVLEAALMGRPFITTTHAHRGHDARLPAGEAVLVADEPQAFADACLRVIREPALAASLARRARSALERHYSFDAFRRVVREAVEGVIAREPGGVRPREDRG